MSYIIDFSEKIVPWLLSGGLRIALIIIIACIALKFLGIFIEKIIRRSIKSDHFLSQEAEKKRENTLIRVSTATLKIVIWIAVVLMVLSEMGINIGPMMAAAGIAGLAFGFGGQYLIRDTISGLFIILENQYRVGDVVCLGTTCGLVEDINLRLTTLRDTDGTVHHIPNGEIKKASNLSKDFSRINIDIGVSYDTDLEKLEKTINEAGIKMAAEEKWKDSVIKAPAFLRVDNFADSAIIVKISGETKPMKQWDVAGEFRKRLKIAFDKNGIEIPYPQIVVREAKKSKKK
jgi:small conductance mechanosensitive channel